jgi:two-component system chemotaxis response regulator CheB
MVEDPETAFASSIPASALEAVAADYVLPLDAIGPKLQELVMQGDRPSVSAPEQLHLEHAAASGAVNLLPELSKIAKPSTLVCPECGGCLATRPTIQWCGKTSTDVHGIGEIAGNAEKSGEKSRLGIH